MSRRKRDNGIPRVRVDCEIHPDVFRELKRRAVADGKCTGKYLEEKLRELFHVEAILPKID